MRSLLSILPPWADRTTALASFLTERYVPANTATTFVLGNHPIPDLTHVYKNGMRMDAGAATPAYTIAGSKVTLAVAANGTDVFIVDYYYRASQ